jgi:flagellar biosynthesis/type III secretory pathway ATPase
MSAAKTDWDNYLSACSQQVKDSETVHTTGRVCRVAGLVMEAVGLQLAVGSPCHVPLKNGFKLEAEVVGFDQDRLFLMPLSDVEGVQPGAPVVPTVMPRAAPSMERPYHALTTAEKGRTCGQTSGEKKAGKKNRRKKTSSP